MLAIGLTGQRNIRNFIFGHSLINHEFQINITPSQETSVPHWLASLSRAADNQYAVSGQYGFLPQHANLPPIAQWGFDQVEGVWDSDNEPFADADFNTIMITPGNFIQWQAPDEDYPTDPISPVEATISVFEWCNTQESDLNFYIYENWPDMAPFLDNDFPPSLSEWNEYNDYLNNDFHAWFLEYHAQVAQRFPDRCISFIPVGTVISKLLQTSPYDQIPLDEIYEDDAPHGRASLYFLASLVTYMSMYEDAAPLDYQVDPIIHPIIADNYQEVINIFWTELNNLHDETELTIFCNAPITSNVESSSKSTDIYLSPNPTTNSLKISGIDIVPHELLIYDLQGSLITGYSNRSSESLEINMSEFSQGCYLVIGIDKVGNILYRERIIKF